MPTNMITAFVLALVAVAAFAALLTYQLTIKSLVVSPEVVEQENMHRNGVLQNLQVMVASIYCALPNEILTTVTPIDNKKSFIELTYDSTVYRFNINWHHSMTMTAEVVAIGSPEKTLRYKKRFSLRKEIPLADITKVASDWHFDAMHRSLDLSSKQAMYTELVATAENVSESTNDAEMVLSLIDVWNRIDVECGNKKERHNNTIMFIQLLAYIKHYHNDALMALTKKLEEK